MAELFILRRWRRSGVGREVVRRLVERFPGRWEIRPFPGYAQAERFWTAVCADVAAGGVLRDTYDRSGTPLRLRVEA